MIFFKKIILKLQIEYTFFLVQKWGIIKPQEQLDLPKYQLRKYLPPNPVIIDCGAHVGSDSIELSRIFPKGEIHSFEPVPSVFNFLKRNTRKRQNIKCYEYALSDFDGKAKMYVSSGSSTGSSSLLKPTEHMAIHPEVEFNETIEVKTLTLDSWAEKNNIAKVDFLWLDMQGYECTMLMASEKILPTIKAIHSEINTTSLYANSILYEEYRDQLLKIGFKVEMMLPNEDNFCNVLFVRK